MIWVFDGIDSWIVVTVCMRGGLLLHRVGLEFYKPTPLVTYEVIESFCWTPMVFLSKYLCFAIFFYLLVISFSNGRLYKLLYERKISLFSYDDCKCIKENRKQINIIFFVFCVKHPLLWVWLFRSFSTLEFMAFFLVFNIKALLSSKEKDNSKI